MGVLNYTLSIGVPMSGFNHVDVPVRSIVATFNGQGSDRRRVHTICVPAFIRGLVYRYDVGGVSLLYLLRPHARKTRF